QVADSGDRHGAIGSTTVQDVRNVADLVRRSATGDGADRPALRWHDRVLTWGELDRQVDAVASGLRAAIGATDGAKELVAPRIAIALPNVPEFAAAYFGALRAGYVVVPVNPGYTARELRYVLSDSGAVALLATPALLDLVETPLPHTYAWGSDEF